MSAFAQVPVESASVAHHDHLDVQAMAHLALPRHKDVRRALAARDDVPLAIQAILALDAHCGVVDALLENPATPPEVLENLAGHALPTVRMKAAMLLLRYPKPGSASTGHPDARIPELMERAPALGEFEEPQQPSQPNVDLAQTQGGLSELDAAIAAAAAFAELTCPVPKTQRPH